MPVNLNEDYSSFFFFFFFLGGVGGGGQIFQLFLLTFFNLAFNT